MEKEIKYSLKDVFIVPAAESDIESRSECDPYINGCLPLFTAPMSSVVDLVNYKIFEKNKITPILPRNIDFKTRCELMSETWCAFSLDEFIFLTDGGYEFNSNKTYYLLIDTANGHMRKLHVAISKAKEKYDYIIKIMAGNIANPETYRILSDAGADYIRVSVGSGNLCITSSNTGIHFPLASLISECYEISLTLKKPAKIIADGGIKGYADVIKVLALGSDYAMCGSLFNKMLESAGETRNIFNREIVDQYSEEIKEQFSNEIEFEKLLYGMSTKKAQKELGSEVLKTSEGVEKTQMVETTMEKWCENFTDYLKSAMSYTNSKTLEDFIGKVETIIGSTNSSNSINK